MKIRTFLGILTLTACSGGLEHISDRDLRMRYYECRHAVNKSAAELQVCQNIRRECERRAAQDNYVC